MGQRRRHSVGIGTDITPSVTICARALHELNMRLHPQFCEQFETDVLVKH